MAVVTSLAIVILSGAIASRSEAMAESKDLAFAGGGRDAARNFLRIAGRMH